MVWSKRVTGLRMMVYVDRKCEQVRTSACTPATLKREKTTRTISRKQRAPTLQTVGCCKLGERLRGWARWSMRVDYDARSFLSFLVYASAAWLASIAPSTPRRSAIRSTLWKSAYLFCRPAQRTDIIWSVETPLICARRPQTCMIVGRYQPCHPWSRPQAPEPPETDPEVKLGAVVLSPGGALFLRLSLEFGCTLWLLEREDQNPVGSTACLGKLVVSPRNTSAPLSNTASARLLDVLDDK